MPVGSSVSSDLQTDPGRWSDPDRETTSHGPTGVGPSQPWTESEIAYAARQRRRWAPRAWMLTLPVDLVALGVPVVLAPDHFRALLTLAVLVVALLAAAGRYRARLHISFLDELPSYLAQACVAAAVVSTVIAFRHPTTIAVVDFMRWAALATLLLVVGRAVSNQVIVVARSRRRVAHPTVVLGSGEVAATLTEILQRYPRYGLRVVGHVDDLDASRPDETEGPDTPRLGTVRELDRVVAEAGADVILIADLSVGEHALLGPVRGPVASRCDLLVVPRLHEFHTQSGLVDHVGAIPIMRIRTPYLNGPMILVKRLFDLVVSCLAAALLSPVMLVAAVAIRVSDGPGVLFFQDRLTRDGRRFQVVKFRTMRPATAAEADSTWSIASDDRVSRVGRLLRRTSVDELPQLWNIVRGDMTLVGPRPERPHFVEQFAARHHRYAQRHRVVSGLTGLAQVSGLRGDTSIGDRARYDNFYIENWSLWLDAKVLIRTVGEVLFARGS